jgi:hypothetical protein
MDRPIFNYWTSDDRLRGYPIAFFRRNLFEASEKSETCQRSGDRQIKELAPDQTLDSSWQVNFPTMTNLITDFVL